MKKRIFILVLLLLVVTACGKKESLRDIFTKNNYVDLGSTFAYADRGNKIGYIYIFSEEVENNYFVYTQGEQAGNYYYKKGLISIPNSECIYVIEDETYSESCKLEDVAFLKLTEIKFASENEKLGLSVNKLTVNSEGLD